MRNLLFFCLICWVSICKSQTPNDFAESFFYFPQNTFTLIPSHAGIDNEMQAHLAYRSYFGQLSALRTYIADLSFNVQKKEKTFPEYNKHMIGAGIYNEREGEFFNRQRILLRYAWHTRLSDKWKLAGGTAFQLINYVFKSSSAGSQGSDFAWSGNLSISLYTPQFRLGISANDFNNPTVQPIDYAFVLNRFYTFHAEKKISVTSKTKLTSSFRANIVPSGISTSAIQLGLVFIEKIELSSFFHYTQGFGGAIELHKIAFEDSFFDFSFGYLLPSQKRNIGNSYEINVKYYFLKTTKKTTNTNSE